jgi:flagellar motor switch protein FliM
MRPPLSQQEIDALLQSGFGQGDSEPIDLVLPDEIRPFEVDAANRWVRGVLPGLEIVNTRFVRLLQAGLFALTGHQPEISVEPLTIQSYATQLDELNTKSHCSLVNLRPLQGQGLVACEPSLIFALIDTWYGGRGKYPPHLFELDYSAISQRAIERILSILLQEYGQAWQGIFPLQPTLATAHANPRIVHVATPGETVVCSRFLLEIGEVAGSLHIVLPMEALAPMHESLSANHHGDFIEVDSRWGRHLAQSLQAVDLTLAAQVGQFDLTVTQLLALKTGDFLPFEPGQLSGEGQTPVLLAKLEGIPVFECQHLVQQDKFALKIINNLRHGGPSSTGAGHE